jgi:hypothetical protein
VVPRPRLELGTPAFSVRCSTKLSYLGTADDCIDRPGRRAGAAIKGVRIRAILSPMKQMLGWVWMGGAIAALIVVQTFRHSEPLVSFDRFLNGAAGLIPIGIVLAIIGAALLLGALVHGMVFDSQPMETGEVSGPYSGPAPGGGWRIGLFKGKRLWGREFYEESGISELKRAWLTGEWLRDHRLMRTTMVLVGLPLLVIAVFGTVALAIDVTAVRLLLVATVAYVVANLGFALIRA